MPVSITDGVIAFSPDPSRVAFSEREQRIRLTLQAGSELIAALSARPGTRSLVVQSPHALLTVSNAAFSVAVSAEQSRVVVERGTVEVVPPAGEPRAIGAGHELVVTPDGAGFPAAAAATRLSQITRLVPANAATDQAP